ncbi:MAG: hypothetical protein GC162_17560 [Planctomycetes bacterium]|nr:hypothetical protein [Planctomycetota bacterium]
MPRGVGYDPEKERIIRIYLEDIRWSQGLKCPRCNSHRVYMMRGKAFSRGLLMCRDCLKTFNVRTGTIFEDSQLPLQLWYRVLNSLTIRPFGMSARDIQRKLDITYKSAWRIHKQIRDNLIIKYGRSDLPDESLFDQLTAERREETTLRMQQRRSTERPISLWPLKLDQVLAEAMNMPNAEQVGQQNFKFTSG